MCTSATNYLSVIPIPKITVDAVLNSTSNNALNTTLNNITCYIILINNLGTMLDITLNATFLSEQHIKTYR